MNKNLTSTKLFYPTLNQLYSQFNLFGIKAANLSLKALLRRKKYIVYSECKSCVHYQKQKCF